MYVLLDIVIISIKNNEKFMIHIFLIKLHFHIFKMYGKDRVGKILCHRFLLKKINNIISIKIVLGQMEQRLNCLMMKLCRLERDI